VVALGSAALEAQPVIDLARGTARDLARATGLEVAVGALAGRRIVFLARAGHHSARGLPVHVGQQVPFVPPLGSVFVAWGDDAAWLEAGADPGQLRRQLEAVRHRGYGVAVEADARKALGEALGDLADMPSHGGQHDLDATIARLGGQTYQLEEVAPGQRYDVSTITAPVFGPAGEVVVALTLLGLAPAVRGAEVIALGERLRDAGLVLTHRTRGRVPAA
jgi:DNA-binding IclR family transcriptional regulator